MLKKVYEFIIRQFQVKNRKDVLLLPLRLAVAYLIARKIADDIRFFRCALETGDSEGILLYIRECVLLCILIFVTWKFWEKSKKKWNPINVVTVFILFNLFTLFLNRSLCFICYIDGPYIGRVTDADTGEPIQGAVVAGSWQIIYFENPWTGFGDTLADRHETVTDRFGWFVLPFGSRIWPWPFSVMTTTYIKVFAPNYDSYPPSMCGAWTSEEAEKWEKKLKQLYPNHPAWKAGTDIRSDFYGESIYYTIFRRGTDVAYMTYRFETPHFFNIRLNRARTAKERREVVRRMKPGKYNCKTPRFGKAVLEEKKRLESMAITEN
ncbi:hypothetical protein DENIS_0925 [Desulfonema ishimotonii]|uniref:Uncharacterized protein n=1 Tax=Desulfonema ishimotonii TaxID=45657 RepID=A0A401FSQ5_9BACT|nr:carboxypeptidase-like regulatory domain-containing protein [Desulfonema ishimotonii]GBC59983.1 hypothetical protein DENIS_0925 [Desulfonema ishimotonii]